MATESPENNTVFEPAEDVIGNQDNDDAHTESEIADKDD